VTTILVTAAEVAILFRQGKANALLQRDIPRADGWFDAHPMVAFSIVCVLGYLAILFFVRPRLGRALLIAVGYFVFVWMLSIAIALSLVEVLYL
jgi:hypothetical protein